MKRLVILAALLVSCAAGARSSVELRRTGVELAPVSQAVERYALERASARVGHASADRVLAGVRIDIYWKASRDKFDGCARYRDELMHGCARSVGRDWYVIELTAVGNAGEDDVEDLEHEFLHILLWRLGVPTDVHHHLISGPFAIDWVPHRMESP